MLQTALHDWHVAHGGRMVDFAGWQMPIQYRSITDEHQGVRQRSGLFDIAHMGRLWISGSDAVRFLDRIVTNHVAKMHSGQIRYSLVCNEQGGVLDDILIYRLENACLLVVNGANREKIVDWLDQHRSKFDVEIDDRTQSTFMLAFQGPLAESGLQSQVPVNLGELRYYRLVETEVRGITSVVSRTGYTGEDGFELIVPGEKAHEVWETLIKTGEPAPLACGLGCRDTLRLEAAMPLYGHEMDETIDPVTAGLRFGVKLDKDEFIGKQALLDSASRTDLPVRVGLVLSGKRIARQGAALLHDETTVGAVTSGTFSPTLAESIAMGYVRRESSAVGTQLDVDIRGKRHSARIVKLPFYKR